MPTKLILASWFLTGAIALGATEGEISETVGGIDLSSQDHLIVASQKDNEEAAQYLMHENRVNAESGSYRAGIHFTNRFRLNQAASVSIAEKPFTLEKKFITADWENWEVKLGDSHQEIGKGIALSLYQDDVFGLNNTLEGVSARYHPSGFELLGFAGRINAITSPVAVNAVENPLKERTVWLVGTSVGGKITERSKVSGHYLLALNQPEGRSGWDKTWTTVGMVAEYSDPDDYADAYGEADFLISHISVAGSDRVLPRGFGAYASLSYAPNPWRLKVEGKAYDQYNFSFRRPPTLEEDIVETTNIDNVSAVKWLADYRFGEGKGTVGSSYLIAYDKDINAPIHHWVANAKAKIGGGVEMETKAGYRQSPERHWLWHASLKTKVKTFKGQYAELGFRKQQGMKKLDLVPVPENRNMIDFTYSFSERLSTSLGIEYLPDNSEEAGRLFANIGSTVRWNALSAKAMIGQTSGGTLCSAGVCRQVPAFTGALLETTYAL